MIKNIKSVSIIGLGLIGGSISLSLMNQYPSLKIYGVDHNSNHAQKALDLKIVHEIKTSEDREVLNSDLIVLAIPVHAILKLLPTILSEISSNVVIIDAGSTKSDICESVINHPNRVQYVAAHPIAGTEYSGPEAAFPKLFEGKKNIFCEFEKSGEYSQEVANWLFQSIGMQSIYMDAQSHDKHLAYVSHLSHISSFTLGLTVLNIEKDEENILNLAGSGFESTVRLAKSSPEMWGPIFQQNRSHLSNALKEYIAQLKHFQKLLQSGDSTKLKILMQEANAIKKVLN